MRGIRRVIVGAGHEYLAQRGKSGSTSDVAVFVIPEGLHSLAEHRVPSR